MVFDSYGDGMDTIDDWIARLRSMPEMIDASAETIGEVLRKSLAESTAAGTSLDGTPWKPTQDGRQPLANAASAVSVDVLGRTIVISLTGHHVYHHFGTKKLPSRPIIPRGGLPDKLGNAIRLGIIEASMDWLQGTKL